MEDLQKYFESHKDKRDFVGHSSKVRFVMNLYVNVIYNLLWKVGSFNSLEFGW